MITVLYVIHSRLLCQVQGLYPFVYCLVVLELILHAPQEVEPKIRGATRRSLLANMTSDIDNVRV